MTDKRKEIKYISAVKSSQRCGTERCGQYNDCDSCLADQILSLIVADDHIEEAEIFKEIEKEFEFWADESEDGEGEPRKAVFIPPAKWQALKKEGGERR